MFLDSYMSLPPWISEQLSDERRVNTKLTERHVVETMYQVDRPYFSIQQIQDQIKPDTSKVTIRDRLNELEERGIVATESFSDTLTLYYIDHPESEWPVSPEGERALTEESVVDENPLREFVEHPRVRSILREELLRSIAWAGLGLFGWAILVTSSAQLTATLWTVVGLPILTWATLTTGMVGFRLLFGDEFRIQSTEGLHVVSLSGIVMGGFWAAFLIVVLNWPGLLILGVYISLTIGYTVYYSRVILPRFDTD